MKPFFEYALERGRVALETSHKFFDLLQSDVSTTQHSTLSLSTNSNHFEKSKICHVQESHVFFFLDSSSSAPKARGNFSIWVSLGGQLQCFGGSGKKLSLKMLQNSHPWVVVKPGGVRVVARPDWVSETRGGRVFAKPLLLSDFSTAAHLPLKIYKTYCTPLFLAFWSAKSLCPPRAGGYQPPTSRLWFYSHVSI